MSQRPNPFITTLKVPAQLVANVKNGSIEKTITEFNLNPTSSSISNGVATFFEFVSRWPVQFGEELFSKGALDTLITILENQTTTPTEANDNAIVVNTAFKAITNMALALGTKGISINSNFNIVSTYGITQNISSIVLAALDKYISGYDVPPPSTEKIPNTTAYAGFRFLNFVMSPILFDVPSGGPGLVPTPQNFAPSTRPLDVLVDLALLDVYTDRQEPNINTNDFLALTEMLNIFYTMQTINIFSNGSGYFYSGQAFNFSVSGTAAITDQIREYTISPTGDHDLDVRVTVFAGSNVYNIMLISQTGLEVGSVNEELGTSLGGTSPENDLTLTVSSIVQNNANFFAVTSPYSWYLSRGPPLLENALNAFVALGTANNLIGLSDFEIQTAYSNGLRGFYALISNVSFEISNEQVLDILNTPIEILINYPNLFNWPQLGSFTTNLSLINASGIYSVILATAVSNSTTLSPNEISFLGTMISSLNDGQAGNESNAEATTIQNLCASVYYVSELDIKAISEPDVLEDYIFTITGLAVNPATTVNYQVAPAGGSGSLMTLQVTRTAASTSYTVSVIDVGTGYQVNDKLRVFGTALGGLTPTNDLYLTIINVTKSVVSFTTSGLATAPVYAVGPVGDTSGTGLLVNVTRSINSINYLVSMVASGQNYEIGDDLSVLGTSLGSSSPANNLLFTITNIGTISGYSVSGLAVDPVTTISDGVIGFDGDGRPVDLLVTRTGGSTEYTASITSYKSGHIVGDVIVVPGTELGGDSTNNLTVTITRIARITDFTVVGTSAGPVTVPTVYTVEPTGGSGTGMSLRITRAPGTLLYSVDIISVGNNYEENDVLSVSGLLLGGADPDDNMTFTINTFENDDLEYTFTGIAKPLATNLTLGPTGGLGSNFEVEVFRNAGSPDYSVKLINAGSYYAVGDVLTVSGSALDAVTPANNLTITLDAFESNNDAFYEAVQNLGTALFGGLPESKGAFSFYNKNPNVLLSILLAIKNIVNVSTLNNGPDPDQIAAVMSLSWYRVAALIIVPNIINVLTGLRTLNKPAQSSEWPDAAYVVSACNFIGLWLQPNAILPFLPNIVGQVPQRLTQTQIIKDFDGLNTNLLQALQMCKTVFAAGSEGLLSAQNAILQVTTLLNAF